MCIKYRGTEYYYGLDVIISSNPHPRHLHILMTKHMKDRPYVYSGVCLDNGLQVNTDKGEKSAALHYIIGEIVDGTLNIEKTYAERYPSQPFRAFKNILEENQKFRKIFTKRMANSLSLDKYKHLRNRLSPFWEKPQFDPEAIKTESHKSTIALPIHKLLAVFAFISIFPHSVPILYDCKDMVIALNMIQADSRLNNIRINYRRV